MSKKSYKQLQNRLYREIKRRIFAEQNKVWIRQNVSIEQRRIETLKIRNRIPCHMIEIVKEDYVKKLMANSLVEKLCEDGYILFLTDGRNVDYDDCIEVEARLDVVKPREQRIEYNV